MENKDQIEQNILLKNDWLREMTGKGEEFKLVMSVNSRDDTNHNLLFRCSPSIRRKLADNGNRIYTLFSKYNVVDRYDILQCFKCQKFNHHSSKCKSNIQSVSNALESTNFPNVRG